MAALVPTPKIMATYEDKEKSSRELGVPTSDQRGYKDTIGEEVEGAHTCMEVSKTATTSPGSQRARQQVKLSLVGDPKNDRGRKMAGDMQTPNVCREV